MKKGTKARKWLKRIFLVPAIGFLTLTAALAAFVGLHKNTELSWVRGVNLGSWLVLEHWMTPEVFYGTESYDEYTLARELEAEDYAKRIKKHRDTYITEKDFAAMADMGINVARIPVPYYIFGDRTDEPYLACIDKLDEAFDWAEKYGIQVLIDMHMVPGSQNGFDNGGISGVCTWAQNPDDVEYVLDVLERLAKRYGKREGLFGIQPLNEPLVGNEDWADMDVRKRYKPVDEAMYAASAPISLDFLKEYYLQAYGRLRPLLPEGKWIVYHDAFSMWNWFTFMSDKHYEGVVFDTHVYLFNVESVGLEGKFWNSAFIHGNGFLMRIMQTRFPVICGEWSLFSNYAMTLEYEEREAYYADVAKEQLEAWNHYGAGGIYWNYRMGDGAQEEKNQAWDLRHAWENGWISMEQ